MKKYVLQRVLLKHKLKRHQKPQKFQMPQKAQKPQNPKPQKVVRQGREMHSASTGKIKFRTLYSVHTYVLHTFVF